MSMPTKASADESIIYLFSSAPPDRPTYKRGALDALCYPNGHQLEFSYRKSYFQSPLFDKRLSLANRKGVFVFVDREASIIDHEFIPIRFVNVLDVAPKEMAARYLDDTRVHVRFELGDLILPQTKWNAEIAALPGRPMLHVPGTTANRHYYYAIEGHNPFPTISELSQRDIWDQITIKVAKAKSLNNCVFLSTGHLRPFRDGGPCNLKPYGKEQKAYELDPNSSYRLDLRVFYPQNSSVTSLDPEIIVRSSSDLLSVSQPFATAHGAEDHSVSIACKRTIESSLATLAIDVEARTAGSSQNFGQPVALAEVVAAKPRYFLSITPPKVVLYQFFIFTLLGFFLTSTSKEFYSDWVCLPEIWAVGSKVVGAASLARAAYLALRKLPSGASG